MSGFPVRTSRSSFGPKPVNKRPVRDPSREVDAAIGHLLFHQVAGLSTAGARAWLTTQIIAGPDVSLVARAESWNANDVQTSPYTPPVVSRVAVGHYRVDYLSEYPDENDDLQPLVVLGLFPKVQPVAGTGAAFVFCERADVDASPPAGLVRVNVRTYQWEIGTSTDWAATDLPFLIALW